MQDVYWKYKPQKEEEKMKFDFFGNKIDVGWDYLFIIIAGALVGGLILVGVDFVLSELELNIPDIVPVLVLVENIFYSANIAIAAAAIFLIGKWLLKGMDKNRIKSICAAYVIIQFVVFLLLFPFLNKLLLLPEVLYLSAPYIMETFITKILAVISGTAFLYLWLIIYNEWNRKKITNVVNNGLLLAAITSVLVSAFWYLHGLDVGLTMDIYYIILTNFIYLSFMITPAVYYLLDKKTLGNVEYFFAGAFVLREILEYATDLELYGRSYSLVALIIVYIWWTQQKKK